MSEARIITFFSTKGGVGKTFLATNLAVALAKEQSKKILLIDLDLEAAGDICRILDAKPKHSLIELINLLPNKNIKKEDFLVHKYGIDILASILKLQQSPYLEPKKIKEVFRIFLSDYDYIVVDAGKTFSQVLLHAFEESNLIILVVNPDILSVYQTHLSLELLQSLGFPLRMFKVILNRAEAASSLSWQEVSVALPAQIIMRIPSEGKAVLGALNRAVPLVLEYPKSKVSLAINKLTEKLIQSEELFILQKKELKGDTLEKISLKRADFWKEVSLAQPPEKISLEEKTDEFLEIKRKIHFRLIEELKLRKLDPKVFSDPTKTSELKEKAEKVITNLLLEEAGGFISSSEVRQRLKKEIIDEALGLGPLEDFLADPEITDIMVNNKDEVYIERRGKIELTSKKFISNEQVRTIIERIIAPIGRHIDESVPMVDARLPDGSR
ncbi:MAG: Flp pilus assembly complex ATPase component TadA, partial [Candidatus Omnitrophica bacterium]|nr:Flp pilus assembly complex ATPase component TadA [Candidatus Omnitrophota bacterium]